MNLTTLVTLGSLLCSTTLFAQSSGKVLVLTNVPGQVLVDGASIGDALPNTPLIHEVSEGDHLVQLAYSNNGKAEVRNEMVTVEAGKQKAVNFVVEAAMPVALPVEDRVADRIVVAERNIMVSGLLVTALNGAPNPSEFMYAFEAGDEVVIDITMSNAKGTNALKVSSYPGGVVHYSNLAFQALTDQRFKIKERAIYVFSLTTNHTIDRNALVKVWRIPASPTTAHFNTNVVQKKVYTPVELVEKHEVIVNSRTSMTGNTRAVVPVSLPLNTVEWYYRFSAQNIAAPSAASTRSLVGELAGALTGSSIMIGTVTGLLGALSTPIGAEACDIFLVDHANYSTYMAKGDFAHIPAAGRTNLSSGNVRVDCCLQGQWYLGLRNNAFSDGIKVQLEVVAITAEDQWVMEGNN